MESEMRPVTNEQPKEGFNIALLICGILSSLYYLAINIFVPMRYPGYSISSQTISELSAIDAPTRPLWVLLCTFYSLLVIAFGWGIWRTAARNRRLRMVAILLLIYGVSGFFWPPMHQREVLAAGGGTLTDTMHIVFTFITVILMMLAIGFGASALGPRFRYYSIATMLLLIGFGAITGAEGPKVSKNLPTPMIGVWERINIAVFMIWVIVLAIVLLRDARRRTVS